MTVVPLSTKSVITVSEMADLCRLSRSRFYDLIEAGVFPKAGLAKPQRKPAESKMPDHTELLDALKGLGLTTTALAVHEAIAALYPDGLTGIDWGDVVRKLFLYLQNKKK